MVALAIAPNLAGQITAYRLMTASARLFKSQIAGTLIGGLVLALPSIAGPEASVSADAVTADALLYASFCYICFHWSDMGETARRIRMLRELAEHDHITIRGIADCGLRHNQSLRGDC